MKLTTSMAVAVTALVSAGIGWWLHGSNPAGPATAGPAQASLAAPSPASTQADGRPVVVVSSDGNVTLRVEQQPLEWVLEQIAQQAGWPEIRNLVNAARSASPPAAAAVVDAPVAEAPRPTAAQTEELLRSIRHGSEADRFDGLLQARNDSATVPDDLLKHLYESDASERVRLLAFEAYLEPRADDSVETRRVLEAALYVANGAIQRDARKRLDELTEIERIDAATVQTAP